MGWGPLWTLSGGQCGPRLGLVLHDRRSCHGKGYAGGHKGPHPYATRPLPTYLRLMPLGHYLPPDKDAVWGTVWPQGITPPQYRVGATLAVALLACLTPCLRSPCWLT